MSILQVFHSHSPQRRGWIHEEPEKSTSQFPKTGKYRRPARIKRAVEDLWAETNHERQVGREPRGWDLSPKFQKVAENLADQIHTARACTGLSRHEIAGAGTTAVAEVETAALEADGLDVSAA